MSIDISNIIAKQHKLNLPQISWKLSLFTSAHKLKDKQKLSFFADLHLLLSAGLDLKTSLDIIEEQSTKDWEKNKIRNVREQIISGLSLADALSGNGIGSDFDFYAVQIGEATGKINDVLKEIKIYYEKKISQKRIVKSAMTYPLMVLFTAIIAVTFMLNVIVPMFEEVFKRFNGELPILTQKIISLSGWFKQNYVFLFIVLAAIVFGISIVSKKYWFKAPLHRIIIKIPFIGRLIKIIHISRFCQTMSLMISARSSLMQSLGLIEKMIEFIPLKSAISQTREGIIAGQPFHNIILPKIQTTGLVEKTCNFTSTYEKDEKSIYRGI